MIVSFCQYMYNLIEFGHHLSHGSRVFKGKSINNINVLVNEIGLSDDLTLDEYSVYALINIVSPEKQEA